MVAETRVEMSNSCLMLMNFYFLYSVHAKMNVHEHRPKQTYESYTFEPLMSFWRQIITDVDPAMKDSIVAKMN